MPLLHRVPVTLQPRWTTPLPADHRVVVRDRLGEPWLERRGLGAWRLDELGPPDLSAPEGLRAGQLLPAVGGRPLWRTRAGTLVWLDAPETALLGGATGSEDVRLLQLDDGAVLEEAPGGLLGPEVICRELVSGAVRWRVRGELPSREVPLDDAVLVAQGGRKGRIACVERSTGGVRWRSTPGPATQLLAATEGHLWVLTADRRVHALTLDRGRIASTTALDFQADAGAFLPWRGGVLTVGRGATVHLRPGEEPHLQAYFNSQPLPGSLHWRLEGLDGDGVALVSDRAGRLLRLDPSAELEPMRRARPTSVAWAGKGGAAIVGRAGDGVRLYVVSTGRSRGEGSWLTCLEAGDA